jgi:hypothetical protein
MAPEDREALSLADFVGLREGREMSTTGLVMGLHVPFLRVRFLKQYFFNISYEKEMVTSNNSRIVSHQVNGGDTHVSSLVGVFQSFEDRHWHSHRPGRRLRSGTNTCQT